MRFEKINVLYLYLVTVEILFLKDSTQLQLNKIIIKRKNNSVNKHDN